MIIMLHQAHLHRLTAHNILNWPFYGADQRHIQYNGHEKESSGNDKIYIAKPLDKIIVTYSVSQQKKVDLLISTNSLNIDKVKYQQFCILN